MSIKESESSSRTDLLQGTLALLVLKALALEELHGMGISRRIAQITNGTFEVKAGSLFPALHRMQEAGLVDVLLGRSRDQPPCKVLSADEIRATSIRNGKASNGKRISLAIASALRAT